MITMIELFKKILVPIDFTEGSEIAIRKAIQLAEPGEAAICLLYICKPLFSLNIFSNTGYVVAPATEILTTAEIEKKIRGYQTYINKNLKGVMVETIISETGKLHQKIEETAILFGPDLIILYKSGGRSLFHFFNPASPERIAQKTDCPVLTIKEGSEDRKIRNIVLPVTQQIPARKLEIAIRLAKAFNSKIHLISFPDCSDEEKKSDHAFIESFKKIRENASLIIKHGPVFGNDIARAVLKYAESVQADMILVNPVTESNIHYIMGKIHISDLLSAHSPIQVLDIEPWSLVNKN
jgi:nucleotide-binding universal stress UspA family protein